MSDLPPKGHCACKFSSGGILSRSCDFHKKQIESVRQGERVKILATLDSMIDGYKAHTDPAGNETGEDFNVFEITALEIAMERIRAGI